MDRYIVCEDFEIFSLDQLLILNNFWPDEIITNSLNLILKLVYY